MSLRLRPTACVFLSLSLSLSLSLLSLLAFLSQRHLFNYAKKMQKYKDFNRKKKQNEKNAVGTNRKRENP